jgi:hypothetical protein
MSIDGTNHACHVVSPAGVARWSRRGGAKESHVALSQAASAFRQMRGHRKTGHEPLPAEPGNEPDGDVCALAYLAGDGLVNEYVNDLGRIIGSA